jgi:hypothetical protein
MIVNTDYPRYTILLDGTPPVVVTVSCKLIDKETK